jgi:hypothetical protein
MYLLQPTTTPSFLFKTRWEFPLGWKGILCDSLNSECFVQDIMEWVSLEYNLKVWQACRTTTSTASSARAVSVPLPPRRLRLRGGRPSLAAQGGPQAHREGGQPAQQGVRDPLPHQGLRECRPYRGTPPPTQDFFYSKTDQGKLIQNIVFEYVDDNLESLIERTLKAKQTLPERSIKVPPSPRSATSTSC